MARIKMSEVKTKLTPEELAEIEAAAKKEITFDEDCPEMTEDMLRQFHTFDETPLRPVQSDKAAADPFYSIRNKERVAEAIGNVRAGKAILKEHELIEAETISFSEQEINMLESARKREIIFDEDCPETTPERATRFRRVNAPKGSTRK